MRDLTEQFRFPILDTSSPERWLNGLKQLGNTKGFHAQLGGNHSATYVDGTSELVVTFATVDEAMDYRPAGFTIAEHYGWSQLLILCDVQNWYRDDDVGDFFDLLIESGFFDAFNNVLFYGIGAGGYGAAAYSLSAPGAKVLMVRPQASLDPRVAGWDNRFNNTRGLCFTDRFGFAPDMLDAASEATVIFDPWETEDFMHAAMFRKDHVQLLPLPGSGRAPEAILRDLQVEEELVFAAMQGRLAPRRMAQLWQRRRTNERFVMNLVLRCLDEGQNLRASVVCDWAIRRNMNPWFIKQARRIAKGGEVLFETEDC